MSARTAALPALLLLVLAAAACCPVPMAGGSETAFSATVEDVRVATPYGPDEGGFVEASLSSGRRVRLALPVGIESPQVGALVWVEGTYRGEAVQVRLLRVIEQVASRAN